MATKTTKDYTTESVLYWDNGWKYREVKHPLVTSSASVNKQVPEFNSFARAPLIKGDKVHALPYWAEKTSSVIPSCSGKLKLAVWMVPGSAPSFGYPDYREGHRLTQRVIELEGDFGPFLPWKLPEFQTWSDAELTFLRKAADTKALAGAKRASLNLALIIKERRETLQMVAERVSSIARSASDLQRQALNEWKDARGRNRQRVAQTWASRHLEAVFGWLPLMGDIEDAVKVFSREKMFTHVKTRGTHTIKDTQTVSESILLRNLPDCDGAGLPDAPRAHRRGQLQQRLSVRTSLRFEISEQWLHRGTDFGFSPLSFAFDAFPMSFVSGWVSNFDQWVRTLEPLYGLEFVTGSRSIKRSADANGYVSVLPVQSGERPLAVVEKLPTGQYSLLRERWDREVLSSLPTAELQWQNNLDWFSITAGISLAIQRYSKPLARLLKEKRFENRNTSG